jgi:hypothetical protein
MKLKDWATFNTPWGDTKVASTNGIMTRGRKDLSKAIPTMPCLSATARFEAGNQKI